MWINSHQIFFQIQNVQVQIHRHTNTHTKYFTNNAMCLTLFPCPSTNRESFFVSISFFWHTFFLLVVFVSVLIFLFKFKLIFVSLSYLFLVLLQFLLQCELIMISDIFLPRLARLTNLGTFKLKLLATLVRIFFSPPVLPINSHKKS